MRETRHLAGLDTLRCVCALWVALHHGARPRIALWLGLPPVYRDWNAIAYDGVAAVIVFFVISGLCVHYPYARSGHCPLPSFFARRFLRIGIPLAVVAAFVRLGGGLVGDDIATATRVVIWSLWCELIYYALYPLFLVIFRRIGMAPVIAGAFVAAYLVIACHWHFLTYWQYSSRVAWITALPVWLLGCAAAQAIATGRLPLLPGSIWAWRGAVLLLSIPPKALVYPSVTPVVIGNPATLGVFALFAVAWVIREVQFFQGRAAPPLLEWGGRWSYSVYLVHNTVLVAFGHLLARANGFALWPVELAAILGVSYVFHLAVERPSHRLAQSVGRFLARQRRLTVLAISQPPAVVP